MGKLILQKISDEGTNNKFIARLSSGIMELRDWAIRSKFGCNEATEEFERVRLIFDQKYGVVYDAMNTTRINTKKLVNIYDEHIRKINCDGIKSTHNTIELPESIDREMKEGVATILLSGNRAIKMTQEILKMFDIEIGFFYQNEQNFVKGLKKLKLKEDMDDLADYLVTIRTEWSCSFINRRSSLEHQSWMLPDMIYKLNSKGKYMVVEPTIDNLLVTSYIVIMSNRIFLFVENILAYTFQKQLPAPIILTEFNANHTDERIPLKRFKISMAGFGEAEFRIQNGYEDFYI